jgi:hypothetical protein
MDTINPTTSILSHSHFHLSHHSRRLYGPTSFRNGGGMEASWNVLTILEQMVDFNSPTFVITLLGTINIGGWSG